MITQHSIWFLLLLLFWCKCLTLPYAILKLFLHNLKRSIMHLEKTAAFSVSRRRSESFLSEKVNHFLYPFSFPTCLPSLFGFQAPLSVHWSPIHSFPTCTLCHTALSFSLLEESPCWKGRKTRLPALCFPACLPGALLSLFCPGGSLSRSSSRAMITELSWLLQLSETLSNQTLTRI